SRRRAAVPRPFLSVGGRARRRGRRRGSRRPSGSTTAPAFPQGAQRRDEPVRRELERAAAEVDVHPVGGAAAAVGRAQGPLVLGLLLPYRRGKYRHGHVAVDRPPVQEEVQLHRAPFPFLLRRPSVSVRVDKVSETTDHRPGPPRSKRRVRLPRNRRPGQLH
ncbi:unnamed protein product, partial [Ectocarpus sp. 12 AP-2014]